MVVHTRALTRRPQVPAPDSLGGRSEERDVPTPVSGSSEWEELSDVEHVPESAPAWKAVDARTRRDMARKAVSEAVQLLEECEG